MYDSMFVCVCGGCLQVGCVRACARLQVSGLCSCCVSVQLLLYLHLLVEIIPSIHLCILLCMYFSNVAVSSLSFWC